MSAAVIRSVGLRRIYESAAGATEALRGVSFEIKRGEMIALRGPSGSGKSTLVAILACADRPTAGSVELNGTAVERLPIAYCGGCGGATSASFFKIFTYSTR